MSTTGSGSDSSSSAEPTGSGSSAATGPRVVINSIRVGHEVYLRASDVEMLLMDIYLRARNDGERELLREQVEQLRKALREDGR